MHIQTPTMHLTVGISIPSRTLPHVVSMSGIKPMTSDTLAYAAPMTLSTKLSQHNDQVCQVMLKQIQ